MSKIKNEPIHINSLPTNALLVCFSFLINTIDVKSFLNLTLVCKLWKNVLENSSLWKLKVNSNRDLMTYYEDNKAYINTNGRGKFEQIFDNGKMKVLFVAENPNDIDHFNQFTNKHHPTKRPNVNFIGAFFEPIPNKNAIYICKRQNLLIEFSRTDLSSFKKNKDLRDWADVIYFCHPSYYDQLQAFNTVTDLQENLIFSFKDNLGAEGKENNIIFLEQNYDSLELILDKIISKMLLLKKANPTYQLREVKKFLSNELEKMLISSEIKFQIKLLISIGNSVPAIKDHLGCIQKRIKEDMYPLEMKSRVCKIYQYALTADYLQLKRLKATHGTLDIPYSFIATHYLRPPAYYLTIENQFEAIKLLLKIDCTGELQCSVIQYGAEGGHIGIIEYLIKLSDSSPSYYSTQNIKDLAVKFAAQNKQLDLVQHLIHVHGAKKECAMDGAYSGKHFEFIKNICKSDEDKNTLYNLIEKRSYFKDRDQAYKVLSNIDDIPFRKELALGVAKKGLPYDMEELLEMIRNNPSKEIYVQEDRKIKHLTEGITEVDAKLSELQTQLDAISTLSTYLEGNEMEHNHRCVIS